MPPFYCFVLHSWRADGKLLVCVLQVKGVAVGLVKGHVVTPREVGARPATRKGVRRPFLQFLLYGPTSPRAAGRP